LETELRKLSLGETRFRFERQARQGIDGVKFSVHEPADGDEHVHAHYDEIRAQLEESALSDFVRQKALAIFETDRDRRSKDSWRAGGDSRLS